MLHLVYFRSSVDLENKSCVIVPLVIYFTRVPGAGFDYFCGLKKALQMSFESGLLKSDNWLVAILPPFTWVKRRTVCK